MFNFSSFLLKEKRSSTSFLMKRTQVGVSIAFETKKRASRESLGRNRLQPIFNKENIINISINSFAEDSYTYTQTCASVQKSS